MHDRPDTAYYIDNGELDGPRTVYYPSGAAYTEEILVNGKRHGPHTTYYIDGKLRS